MDDQHRSRLRWLLLAWPVMGGIAVLHGVSLFIPLNNDGPGEHMGEALWTSADRLSDNLAEFVKRGHSPDWWRLLEDCAMAAIEIGFLLVWSASPFVGRWFWTIPVMLWGLWGLLTGYLVWGYAFHVSGPWRELPTFFWERLGWGFAAWYGTLLLAATTALGLEWWRRVELRRHTDSVLAGEE